MEKPSLLRWYTEVLAAADAHPDETGFVHLFTGDKQIPAKVETETGEAMQLALPTDTILSKHYANTVRFHPLAEDFTKGPSPVIEAYRQWFLYNYSTTAIVTIIALLEMTASHGLHASLTPVQSELLSIAKNAKQSTIDTFKKLIAKISIEDNDFQIARVFLKKSPRIGDRAYQWGAIVSFPLYEQLKARPKKLKSVTLSNEFLDCILAIFRYLYRDIDVPHAYSFGSNSDLAPKFESVLGAMKNLCIEVNALIQELGNQNQGIEEIELGWAHYLDNTNVFRSEVRMIPMQPGNEGQNSKLEQGFIEMKDNKPYASAPVREQVSEKSVVDPIAGIQTTSPTPASAPATNTVQAAKKMASLSDLLGTRGAPQAVGVVGNTMMPVGMANAMPAMGMGMGMGVGMQQPMAVPMQQPQMVQTPQGVMVSFNNQWIPLQQYQMLVSGMSNQNPALHMQQNSAFSSFGRPVYR